MIHRIVLTGGPCAGKTTSLAAIRDYFTEKGFNVYTVPEAATVLFTNGVKPTDDEDELFDLQKHILGMQVFQQEIFNNLASLSGKPSIVLCDRGHMDSKAFVSEESWWTLLDEVYETEGSLRDAHYDAVVHLVTAADGAEAAYSLENNTARRESRIEAVIQDRRIKNAWTGHPHFTIIDNSTNFANKVKRVIKTISKIVGVPEPLEIERKYLVERQDMAEVQVREAKIVQIYLNDASRIRRREADGYTAFTHTMKTRVDIGTSIEKERIISEREFEYLRNMHDPHREPILKRRLSFVYENRQFELDIFSKKNGLQLMEVELNSIDEEVKLPPFVKVLQDVTGNPDYNNSEIARPWH